MMRFLLTFFIVVPNLLFSQQDFAKVWLETGVAGKITKDLSWGVDLTTRFGNYGLETYFPQASLKYKVAKWFKPSIDYRLIGDRTYFDERYTISHRINVNAEFKEVVDRFTFKQRIRYQFAFGGGNKTYDSEFDQALRVKVEGLYDLNNFFLSPVVSCELFYDPQFSQYGQRINKLRLFVGFDSDFDSPHSFSFGYMFDSKLNVPNIKRRHILSLSYGYEIGYKSKKKDKK